MKRSCGIIAFVLACFYTNGVAIASISLTGGAVSENFDSMTAGSATASVPTDWKVEANASIRTLGTYSGAGTACSQTVGGGGTATTGAVYNCGAGSDNSGSDRAVGGLCSTAPIGSVNIFAQFQNGASSDLTALTISYDVEKYRKGTLSVGFTVQMYYSTDGSSWTSAGSKFATSWPGSDPDNNVYATTPGDTKSVTNQTLVLPAHVVASGTFYLAWNISPTSGASAANSQLLALDNFSVTPSFASGSSAWNNSTGGTINIPGDYPDLATCATDFNAVSVNGGTGYSINGNWIVNIGAGTYTHLGTVLFANTVHPTNGSVMLRPASAAAVALHFAQTSGNSATNGGILIGASSVSSADAVVKTDNFTIDGSNGGSSLTITNAVQNGFLAYGIHVYGSSSNGFIKNCTITNSCSQASANTHCVQFTGRHTATPADLVPNGWTVQNCILDSSNATQAGCLGCSASGSVGSGTAISGLIVTSCTLTARQKGILLNLNSDATITSNIIQITQSTTGNVASAIRHQTSNSATGWTMTIANNTINKLEYGIATGAFGVNGMYFDSTGPANSCTYNIYNNTIGGFAMTNGTAADKVMRGIYALTGGPSSGVTFNIYHNSINIPSTNANGGTTADISVVGIGADTDGYTFNVKNNVISLAQAGASGTQSTAAIYKHGGSITANGNTIWVTGSNANFGILNGTASTGTKYSTFSGSGATSWQDAAGANQDANGQGSFDPVNNSSGKWTSGSNLHFTPTTAAPTGLNYGVSGLGITGDIDGDSRFTSKPYPGADEIPSFPLPVTLSEFSVE